MADKNIVILGWCSQCKNVIKMNDETGEIFYIPQREAGRIKPIFKCDKCRSKNCCKHRGHCVLYDIFFNDVCTNKDEEYCQPTTITDKTEGIPNDTA